MDTKDIDKMIELLKAGKVVVTPTDTTYGVVGSAFNTQAVERIYDLRKRDKDKPMVILISSLSDLEKFDIKLTNGTKKILEKLWPNPVSAVLKCPREKFSYLHRGKKTLAFRVPKDEWIHNLLAQTGPLVAPSANIEGKPVAENTSEAKKYFGRKVTFYLDKGRFANTPSTLIEIRKGRIKVLRQGVFAV